LVEIFLPLSSNEGTPLPSDEFGRVREQLIERWGGVTAFTRTPAKGVTLQNGNERAEDEIVVYEVMVKRVDKLWWLTYKRDLETRFGQQEILIRVTAVDVIH
jgi:hypothetical protein